MNADKEYLVKTLDIISNNKAENKKAVLYVNPDTFKQCLVLKEDMIDASQEIKWLKNEVCDFCYDYYAHLAKDRGAKFAKAAEFFDRQEFASKKPRDIFEQSTVIAHTLGILREEEVETL